MTLSGDTSAITAPGQFVNIQVPGFYLRRPLSVCDWTDGELTLIYKVVGEGSAAMRRMQPGTALDLLVGLGNGFDTTRAASAPILVGGGLGAVPMLALWRRMPHAQVVLGFASVEDAFLKDELEAQGARVTVATVDGSLGIKGFVTDAMAQLDYDYVYACGPEPMLKAVHAQCGAGQFSFEARMACGFGACMGCSCVTKYGNKRICKDGPVLSGEEIIW